MKKTILSLSLLLPVLASAQTTEASDQSSNLMPLALFVLGLGIIIAVTFVAVGRSMDRKNEILNSNIEHLKVQLAAQGHEPVTALINILHRESATYKEPEPIIIYQDKEVSASDENILASLEEAVAEPQEANHTLALKVADEIVRIQKNLSQMDEGVKGLKQLNASVDRIANNFAANGYEIVNMLNKPFNEGMKVEANFIPSEEIAAGQQIITRIIKPQVNFENKMIQAAQVEVSIGE